MKLLYGFFVLIPGLFLPLLALAYGPGRMGDGMMGNWFSSGMGAIGLFMMLIWVLLVVLLILAILALIKYLWKK